MYVTELCTINTLFQTALYKIELNQICRLSQKLCLYGNYVVSWVTLAQDRHAVRTIRIQEEHGASRLGYQKEPVSYVTHHSHPQTP